MARVAFIGLGRMGSGMAGRLIAAGHDLTVFNRSPGKTVPLVTAGAHEAPTPAAAASGADAVFVMVNDDAASREVWLGERGVLSGDVRPGTFAIECSTLSHKWTMQLADAARAHRLRYLDAPVTGLPDDASAGTLTLFIGARQKDLDDASPLLQAVAQDWIHFGQVGAGTAYKLIVNLMGAVQIGAVAESMAIAERAGLDLDLVAEAISRGQAASPQVVRNSRRMAAGEHDAVVFTGALRRKDAAYGVELAEQLGLGVRFGDAALAGLDGLVAAGLGDKNESSIIEIARRIPARNPAMPS